MSIKKLYNKIMSQRWEIGIMENTYSDILNEKLLNVRWVVNSDKNCWFADPFLLDVNETSYIILAEEMPLTKQHKGVITKLVVNKDTMEITEKCVLLELPTHLSFPAILRVDGKTFVYPENCQSKTLKVYDYSNNKLTYSRTVSDDIIWDSIITYIFGEPLMFTAKQNDYFVDVYRWSKNDEKFKYWQSVQSTDKNSRMAGDFFAVDNRIYCPCQDCSVTYGGAVVIKEVRFDGNKFIFIPIKKISSMHSTLNEGLHTLNSYKDTIVFDVKGFNYPNIAHLVIKMKKYFHL